MATTTELSCNIEPYWKMNKSIFLETINMIKPKLYINGHLMVPYKVSIFMGMGYPRWLLQQDLVFKIGSYGKIDKQLFIETTNLIEPKQ
jgi:hypothetical protein